MLRWNPRAEPSGEDYVNVLMGWKQIGSEGGFTTVDVARLLERRPSQIAAWLKGSPPLIEADYHPLHGRPVLSFDALIEARAISHFLAEGMKAPKLRRIMRDLRKQTGERHPLATDRELVTNGFQLLEVTDRHFVDLANQVYAHVDLMRPALIGRVHFEGGRAKFFEPDPVNLPSVRVDPKLSYGRPVVIDGGKAIPTNSVAATAEDEGLKASADWFGISQAAAQQAWDFERRLAA